MSNDGMWWSRVMDPNKWDMDEGSGMFALTGEWQIPDGMQTVYLEWHGGAHDGPMIPGRLLPSTIEYEGCTYQFDGMEAKRARYTRVSK